MAWYHQNQPPNGAEAPPPIVLPFGLHSVPTPVVLAVVMRHALQLLNRPATDSLYVLSFTPNLVCFLFLISTSILICCNL